MEPRRVPYLDQLGPTAAGKRAMRDVVAGLWDTVPSAARGTGGWFTTYRLGFRFWTALVSRYVRHRTIRTLEALDNRALADIGVNRGQIPAIAAAAAEGHDGRRGERAEAGPMAGCGTAPPRREPGRPPAPPSPGCRGFAFPAAATGRTACQAAAEAHSWADTRPARPTSARGGVGRPQEPKFG